MERDKIIILALAVAVVALAAGIGYMMFAQSGVEYQTIALSGGTTVEVPKTDDANWIVDDNGIRTYSAPSKKTMVTAFNSAENLDSMGAKAITAAKDKLFSGSTAVEKYKSYNIKENNINGTHYYMVYISNNETNDTILMCSEDLDVLKHMVDTLVFGDPNAVKKATGTAAPKHVNNSKNKYSEDDLMLALQEGYIYGYLSGYGDSYDNYYYDDGYDDYYYDDYDYDDYSYDDYDYYEGGGQESGADPVPDEGGGAPPFEGYQ